MANFHISDNATLGQTMDAIKKVAINGALDSEVKAIAAKAIASPNPIKAAFDLVYNCAYYMPDPHGKQYVQTVGRTLSTHQANCVDYSVLLAAVLINMKVPFVFKVVSFNGLDYEHIYIQTKDGIKLDCVPGHRQDGTDTFTNRPPQGKYNFETNYKKEILYPMPQLEILNGINAAQGQRQLSRSRMVRTESKELNGFFSRGGALDRFGVWFDKTLLTPVFSVPKSLIEASTVIFKQAPNIVGQIIGGATGNETQAAQNAIPQIQMPNTKTASTTYIALAGGAILLGSLLLTPTKKKRR